MQHLGCKQGVLWRCANGKYTTLETSVKKLEENYSV